MKDILKGVGIVTKYLLWANPLPKQKVCAKRNKALAILKNF